MTDKQMSEIMDRHLPSQGEPFDWLAFARDIEAAARADERIKHEAKRLTAVTLLSSALDTNSKDITDWRADVSEALVVLSAEGKKDD